MKNINTIGLDMPHMLLFLQLLALTSAVPLDDQLTVDTSAQASTNNLQPNPLTKPIFQSAPAVEATQTALLQADTSKRLTTSEEYPQDPSPAPKRKGGERKEFARFPY
ncbi:hypothetical protein CONCODRAFT_73013 [Conidiobolus coronatus NRRL 28638]|uniref:Uncharacterized protein n=1 Tax=Conidiobolus coronatus (strain ATCC 28846 / CBS 209.66 / NRRL 28638) TaxID=796925 RepID=A0A137NXH1_CONC2|nr:hypothetical protein CONCODRAFT_73013 [Conidiobolus coronatus NRRL 28638]|eukprot:KXN67364.1 hypothetical protein CONCODRAFT_73013 [Conidiobolus coronatus NRRL 28638]